MQSHQDNHLAGFFLALVAAFGARRPNGAAATNAHAAVCICSVVCNQGKMAFFPASGSVD